MTAIMEANLYNSKLECYPWEFRHAKRGHLCMHNRLHMPLQLPKRRILRQEEYIDMDLINSTVLAARVTHRHNPDP